MTQRMLLCSDTHTHVIHIRGNAEIKTSGADETLQNTALHFELQGVTQRDAKDATVQ